MKMATAKLATVCLLIARISSLEAFSAVVAQGESPSIRAVKHTPEQPRAGKAVVVSARFCGPAAPKSIVLRYQLVDPGKYIALTDAEYKTKWVSVPMNEDGKNGEAIAGEKIYSATLPAELQIHRRLVRYRITVVDTTEHTATAPAADDSQSNFAYYVYNGVPGWSGAIDSKSSDSKKRQATQFTPEVMRSVQTYQLIAKSAAVEKATWFEQARGKDYKYTGTLVFDSQVYDHVRFRARGGVWRYAMGKNMWKFDFNSGHYLQARDNYGQPYRTKWGKLNLRSCIQLGDFGKRGEQGMFEAVGFKLFNLVGVEAPNTHWIHLRIVTDAVENPADQYRGDFWGLYLAIENEDGRFLKAHELPDGNLYKMGIDALNHQGANAVTNGSDLRQFMMAYHRRNQPEAWWRENVDLPRYYSYRSIIEAIHHYDVGEGKNYDYYHNPGTKKWIVIPWDLDLSWADNMYGSGNEPFKQTVLSRPAFALEYQNRLREIRDLLFNPEQTGQLIDEYAALIADPAGQPSFVDADRAKWDYHPIMVSPQVLQNQAGHGLFYQASATGDFAGMVQLMKNYVKRRSAYIDRALLNDPNIPATPQIAGQSSLQLPVNRLAFHAEIPGAGTQLATSKWRLGEITDPKAPTYKKGLPNVYEITPVWESDEFASFQGDVKIPAQAAKVGHAYRVRVRVKDSSGRWSHWSAPVQFIASDALR
ncbi:MAG: CotH kinase family protein [Verrucomicrobia bacterium]|nr:CotH kinase family protein [Verrucomicrobiota bacterium]